MKRYFLIGLVCLNSSLAAAQTASTKTIDETCGCVKEIKTSLSEEERLEEAVNCMNVSLIKHFDDLKKQYKVKSSDQKEATQAIGSQLGVELVKGCPEMTPYLLQLAGSQNRNSSQSPDINPDTLKLDPNVCKNFKTVKYNYGDMYANNKRFADQDKTFYTEVKDGYVYDYRENKKSITKWSIKWLGDCEWEHTFIESNDPDMEKAFKKGDKVKMKAIGSTPDGGLWISADIGMNLIWLAVKME